jgi:hypothetical protein
MVLAVISGWAEIVQSVDWSPTTECTLPDQETSERRPYAPQGVTVTKLLLGATSFCTLYSEVNCNFHFILASFRLYACTSETMKSLWESTMCESRDFHACLFFALGVGLWCSTWSICDGDVWTYRFSFASILLRRSFQFFPLATASLLRFLPWYVTFLGVSK